MGSSSSRQSTSRPRSSSNASAAGGGSGGEGPRTSSDRRRFTLSSLLCGTSFGDASGTNQMEDKTDDAADVLDVGSRSPPPHSARILSSSQSSNSQHDDHIINGLSCNFTTADNSSSRTQLTGNTSSSSGLEDDSLSASASTSYSRDSISEHNPSRLNSSNVNETLVRNREDESVTATVHEPSLEQHSVVDERIQESSYLNSDLLTAIRSMEPRNNAVLHVDVLSISSEMLTSRDEEIHDNDSRSGRNLFWDAFLRQSSRRNGDVATLLLATEGSGGSRDRWLLDFDASESSIDDEFRFLSRRQGSLESQSSNLELPEILRDDSDERRTAMCASGLHPDGTCSCDSLLIAEGLRAHASISRIVVLAEALFEVLDEIHQHSVPFPLSMASHPASEAVVNSFPLKTHKKLSTAEDADQCYICLAEYEDGDEVRVLPCKHEYHMSCVDKWLKDIHGVCPLCRRNVSETVDINQ